MRASWMFVVMAGCGLSQGLGTASADIRLDSQEAEAALAVAAGQPAWDRLASTDGYRRLKKREAEMGRAFEDEDFRQFLSSESLRKQRAELTATLAEWKQADFRAIGDRVRSYLPPEAKLRATVYIVVKPRTNSFVYEVTTNPAVFLYLDPAVTKAEFENTVAHELHHVGLASLSTGSSKVETSGSSGREQAKRWVGAFGEGLAMLAAAGGPDVHPHQHSSPEVRARWDQDVRNLASDMRAVEAFLLDTIGGKLDENQQREKAMSFYGTQGPWYTVGYTMAVTVEKAKGRSALIDCMREMPKLLRYYNEAADNSKPKWSQELVEALLP
jgi:hypothetical protein